VPLPSIFLKSGRQEPEARWGTVAGVLAALPAPIGRAEDNETVLTSVHSALAHRLATILISKPGDFAC
jgi:hypothetical protein